jgi:hypothetical protein
MPRSFLDTALPQSSHGSTDLANEKIDQGFECAANSQPVSLPDSALLPPHGTHTATRFMSIRNQSLAPGLRAQVTGIWATAMVSSAATAASEIEGCLSSAALVSPALMNCGLASKNEYSRRRLRSPRK